MPWVRVTLNFAIDKYAWSEAHIFFTSSSQPLAAAYNSAQQLAQLRVATLGIGASLLRVRMATYPAARQVQDLYPPQISSLPTWGPDPTGLLFGASRPFEALMAVINASDGSTRNYYMAGVPSSMLRTAPFDQQGIQWASCPDFSGRAAALNSFLTNGNWGWATRRDSAYQQVQAVVTNAAFPSAVGLVLNAQVPAFQVGTQVTVRNFRRINVKLPKLGAIWTISGILPPVAPATQWTYFLLNSGAVPTNNYKGMGQVAAIVFTARIYQTLQWVEATQRKRGGTSLRPRGRSRSRI